MFKGLEHTWTQQMTASPPCSPSSLGSRKSSYCSLSSADSSAFAASHGVGGSTTSNSHYRNPQQLFSSANQVYNSSFCDNNILNDYFQVSSGTVNGRFKASHDSGIASSQDVIYSTNCHDSTQQQHNAHQQQQHHYHHPHQQLIGRNNTIILSQQSTPSPSSSAATWPETMTVDDICDSNTVAASMSSTNDGVTPRAHTIGTFDDWKQQQQRAALTSATFVAPNAAASSSAAPTRPSTLSGLQQHERGCDAKPPLPAGCFRRPYAVTTGTTPLMVCYVLFICIFNLLFTDTNANGRNATAYDSKCDTDNSRL